MGEKTDREIFNELLPDINKRAKIFILYISQLILFIFVLLFYWWISSKIWFGAIVGQIIVSTLLVFHFIYLARKAEKIRRKYKEKYGSLACQKFWYHFQSYTIPVICAAYYMPLILITYYFLPSLINMPKHFINTPLFNPFISIPLGFFFLIIGFFMRRRSGGYGLIEDNYFSIILPEKSKLITDGIYSYIRNPQYLGRGLIAIGFGFVANNISAITVGLIHLISYCAIIPDEDNELIRRFGDDFREYKKKVPALFPKYGNWKKFLRYIFAKGE